MKTLLACVIAAYSASAGSGSAQAVITEPDWLKRPAAEDFSRAYPTLSAMLGVGGRATISCDVVKEGALHNCTIGDETPKGLGFGAAALSMSSSFKMKPRTIDGSPVDGGRVKIPIRFQMMERPPATPTAKGSYNKAKLALAMRLVEARKLMVADADAFERGLPVMRRMMGRDVDSAVWDEVMTTVRSERLKVMDEYTHAIAGVYAEAFSDAELKELVSFAESDVGKTYTLKKSKVTRESTFVATSRYAEWSAIARRKFCDQVGCVEAKEPVGARLPNPQTGMIYQPDWAKEPDRFEVMRAAPQYLTFMGLSGAVGLVCRATSTGALQDCRIDAESPADLGYGRAALTLVDKYRLRTKLPDGGAPVWLVINFQPLPMPAAMGSQPARPTQTPSPRALALAKELVAAENAAADEGFKSLIDKLHSDPPANHAVAAAAATSEAMRAVKARSLGQLALVQAANFNEAELEALVAYRSSAANKADVARQSELKDRLLALCNQYVAHIFKAAGAAFCAKHTCN